jgi:predicted deacylase
MSEALPAWQDVAASAKTTFTLPVAVRADGTSIGMPVVVVRGAQPGRTLVVSAGVHGDEYEGMRAIHLLTEALALRELRGTFVAVPIVNPPAFEAGLRVNPDDRQDMARIFPGDPDGTVTEQLAYALTHRFIRHADLFCDLHSAGQLYTMPPLCGYCLTAEPMLTRQRQAARAFGLPLVWGTPYLPGRSLSVAAEHKVPAIYAEITGEGRCRPADVAAYLRGLRGLLGYLEMAEPPPAGPPPRVVEDQSENAGFLQRQLRTPVGGLFEALAAAGDRVAGGQELGVVRDAFGQVRFRAAAPVAGTLVFLRTFARVLPGDPLCCVLRE